MMTSYRTVLLVEDSPDDELLALRALRNSGMALDVRVARDGEQALYRLGLFDSQLGSDVCIPDLVISDFKVPKVSGDEILRRVRADDRFDNVPYVMFSSSDEPRDIEKCLALGASEYATKPLDYDEFLERAEGIARKWL